MLNRTLDEIFKYAFHILNETEVETNTFSIPEENNADFLAAVAKFQKRASKLGLPAIQVIKKGTEIRRVEINQQKFKINCIKYEILGSAPKVNGWKFIAVIDHSNEAGNLIRMLPNSGVENVPTKYRTSPPTCDHCETKRYRNDTYLLMNDHGEYKQVGKTCLKDFLGHDVSNITKYTELLAYIYDTANSMEDYEFGSGRGRSKMNMNTFLLFCSACIKEFGWTSKKQVIEQGGGVSTADKAMRQMWGPLRSDETKVKITDDDQKIVEEAIEWANNLYLTKKDMTDYEYNLSVIAGSHVIDLRAAGLAASLIPAYLRHKEYMLRKAAVAENSTSQWLGKENEKIEVPVTVVRINPKESFYGTSYITNFVTDDGNNITWFATSLPPFNAGDKGKLKATIKKLDTFNGQKITVVVRCKLIK